MEFEMYLSVENFSSIRYQQSSQLLRRCMPERFPAPQMRLSVCVKTQWSLISLSDGQWQHRDQWGRWGGRGARGRQWQQRANALHSVKPDSSRDYHEPELSSMSLWNVCVCSVCCLCVSLPYSKTLSVLLNVRLKCHS